MSLDPYNAPASCDFRSRPNHPAASPGACSASLCRQRQQRIAAYIEDHLSDPSLCARHAARALGMSLRSLYLALEGNCESFASLVQRRRLETAMILLRNAAEGITITDLAFMCGFNSIASFYRAFRRRFDACPRDFVGLRGEEGILF